MRVLSAVVIAALVVSAPLVHGATVEVTITDRSSAGACRGSVVVSAVPDGGGKPLEITTQSATSHLELNAAHTWELRATREGCWSATRSWLPTSAERVVSLELFAAATLHGTFVTDRQQKTTALSASAFRVTPGRTSAVPLRDPEPLDCTVAHPKWECTIAAELPLDVRLEPQGFANAYLFDVTAHPGERRATPPLKLIAGASIAGWIHDPEDAPIAGAVVTLAPLQAQHEEAGRTVAMQHRATSNAKGFFQFAGVPPGDYRLVSRTPAFPPAVVPIVTIRPLTSATWPRPIRHEQGVTLEVQLEPSTPAEGSEWRVELNDAVLLTPGVASMPIPLKRNDSGVWSASGLRAGHFELVVRAPAGVVVERRTVDLSQGSPGLLTIDIRSLAVNGVVKAGDEPLPGAVVLFSGAGRSVRVTCDEEGAFTTAFPAPGMWTPLVYPYGSDHGATVRASAVDIRDDASEPLEILLPGGRIRGEIVAQGGTPQKGAVHVVRNGKLAAQQTTRLSGAFDFLGLAEGRYLLSAEADEGATARPVEVTLESDETVDVKLTLEPYRTLRGVVRTPAGRPASGAVIRLSTDGGVYWSDIVAGIDGGFEYVLAGGLDAIALVAVTSAYPSAILRVALSASRGPLAIELLPEGGILRVNPPRAFVFRGDIGVPLNAFYLPPAFGLAPLVRLEPGSYSVCPNARLDTTCKRVMIAPGTTTNVNLDTP